MVTNLLPGFATLGIESIFAINKAGNYTMRVVDMFRKTKAQPFTFTIAQPFTSANSFSQGGGGGAR